MKINRPTGSVSLHNIERARFLTPIKIIITLGVALHSTANKKMITINVQTSLVPLLPFLIRNPFLFCTIFLGVIETMFHHESVANS